MVQTRNLRSLCLILLSFCAMPAAPAQQQPLAATIQTLLAVPNIAADHWGISVTTLDGASIYALNDAERFHPASDVKLFTTAAALHLLGPKRFFITTLNGAIDKADPTTIDGNLTLAGGGDANFSGRPMPYQVGKEQAETDPLRYLKEFADTLAKRGVKHITGDLVVSDELWPWEPYASGWDQDDLVWDYGAPVSAFNIDDNYLNLTVHPAATVGGLATLEFSPDLHEFYKVVNHMTTVSSGPTVINVDRSLFSQTFTIAGSIALNSPPDKEELSIDDPASYGTAAFKDALTADGISIAGESRVNHREYVDSDSFHDALIKSLPNLPTQANSGLTIGHCFSHCPLIRHSSPTVLDDVILTNKLSLNLHAEIMLRQLGKQFADDGTFAQGARVVRQFAINAGVLPDDFLFYDGSGLSTYDLAAPRAFTALLRYAATQPWGADFKSSLPIGGVDGTLQHRFTTAPLKGHVFAKTGTGTEDRTLSGYLTCASGRTVVFSILVNNHLPGSPAAREAIDRIVAAIAAAN
jgi:D-alanyl-D-alanine carboxypeptidase/D-alanyl-D-alanine-endopeptidase (penicillin-binding protein 4)